MGFTGIKDFFRSFFGLWYAEIILIIALITSIIYFGAATVINSISFIYEPKMMMIILWIGLLLDWFSGIYLALKNHDFRTDKAKRILPTAVGQTFLLMALYYGEIYMISELGQGETQIFHYFRIVIHNYMYLVIVMSFAVNLYRAKLISWGVIAILEKYVDRYKLKITKPIEK